MKKNLSLIVIILITAVFSTSGYCQRPFRYSTYVNGYWGDWKESGSINLRGSYEDFIIVDNYRHPSEYILRVTIDKFTIETDKEVIKLMIKSDLAYKFTGTVEYYSNSNFPDFTSQLVSWPYLYDLPNARQSGVIKKVQKATIKVQPYKKEPEVFNIFFDNVGIAVHIL